MDNENSRNWNESSSKGVKNNKKKKGKKKLKKFDPNQSYVKSAVENYIKKGGRITKIEQEYTDGPPLYWSAGFEGVNIFNWG